MTTAVVVIFLLVYLGMILGALPFLQLDRTGIALLGAIAMVAIGALTPEQAALSIHLPTLVLLFAFMVISAQMRLGGFYAWITHSVAGLPISPPALLAALIAVIGVLAAVFSNDIVCLAAAPVLAETCLRRRLDPVPFLLGLACAANIGSALTLIGNPQNMLIGAKLALNFVDYFCVAAPVVVPGLVLTWALICWQSRGRWYLSDAAARDAMSHERRHEQTALDGWQTVKGLAVAAVLLVLFVQEPIPRETAALTAAGLLLMSRKFHSTNMLGLVDWELLVLFIGLFVVNRALQDTGIPAELVEVLAGNGIDLTRSVELFAAAFVLSNVVSNVPATMLLLPVATDALAGPLLALVTTLAGNLLIVGSIANIIVVAAAARLGIAIGWRVHARVGIAVTFSTLALAAGWLYLLAQTSAR
jgi:Na+/H+ antiporter NhaD/arsenite permease-like protein